jgi:pSer/pThr/pTyr-binding forkhead associated (FHA) protein
VSLLAIETDETLLILKIAFLVLLYGFIVLVVRSATRGMEQAPPQESIVLGAAEAAQLRAEHGFGPARLLVLKSPELAEGRTLEIAAPTVIGRDGQSGIPLGRDDFASGRHARIEPRPDGVWLDDLGSTNGTYVNGKRLERAQLVRAGEIIRVGETELQVQA